jgi:hypothetical protein
MMLCIVSANVNALFGLFGIYLLKKTNVYILMGAKNRQDVLDPTTDTRTNVKKMNKEAVSWLMTIRVRYMTASFQADVTHHKVCVCVLYSLYLIG